MRTVPHVRLEPVGAADEAQRYTKDRKTLAASGTAKLPSRSENTNVTNIEFPLRKHGANVLR